MPKIESKRVRVKDPETGIWHDIPAIVSKESFLAAERAAGSEAGAAQHALSAEESAQQAAASAAYNAQLPVVGAMEAARQSAAYADEAAENAASAISTAQGAVETAEDAAETAEDAAQKAQTAVQTATAAAVAAVPQSVTDWLEDNVTPVGSAVTVDASLSIEGSAADAKAAGDLKSALDANIDITNITWTSDYAINSSGSAVETSNDNASDYIKVYPNTTIHAIGVDLRGPGRSLCGYDANKNFISPAIITGNVTIYPSTSSEVLFDVPEGVEYIRFTRHNTTAESKLNYVVTRSAFERDEAVRGEVNELYNSLADNRTFSKFTVSAKYVPSGNSFSPADMPFNTWWAGSFSTVKTALTTGAFSGFPLSANDNDTIRVEKYEQYGGQTAFYIFRLAGDECKCVSNYAGTSYTWTVYATNRNTIIANRIVITAANKAKYFIDADNAPENTWFEIQAAAQIANTPLGNGISTASGVYTDLRSITGYLDGSLYTYKTGAGTLVNQIFISSGKHASAKTTPNVMYLRTKYTGGLWGDWSKVGGNSNLTASNIAIRKKMIAPYLDGDGNPTATNTGTANPQYMGDDPLIFSDFNDAPPMSIYQIDLDCDASVMANNPEPGYSSILITAGFSYVLRHGQVQLCVGVKSSGTFAWIRYGYQQAANDYRWSAWKSIV